jgi:hypothetical protein
LISLLTSSKHALCFLLLGVPDFLFKKILNNFDNKNKQGQEENLVGSEGNKQTG